MHLWGASIPATPSGRSRKVSQNTREVRKASAPGTAGASGAASAPADATLLPSMRQYAPRTAAHATRTTDDATPRRQPSNARLTAATAGLGCPS
jgi:hypothetical protein